MDNLTAPDPARLARLCGLLASEFDGERANAAAMATRELRRFGLTWADLVSRAFMPVAAEPPVEIDDVAMLRELRARASVLSPWELAFIDGLARWRGRITPKQRATLRRIFRRAA